VDHPITKINRIMDLHKVTSKIMIMATTNIENLHHFHPKTIIRTAIKILITQIKIKIHITKTTLNKTKRETGKKMGNKSRKNNKFLTKVMTKINTLKMFKGNRMMIITATLPILIKMKGNRVDNKMDRISMTQPKLKGRNDKVAILKLTFHLQEKMITNEIIGRDRGQGNHLRIMIMIRIGVVMIRIETGMITIRVEAIMIREVDMKGIGEKEHSHLIHHITINLATTCIGIKHTDHHPHNNIKTSTRIEVSPMVTMEVHHHLIRIEDHHKVTTNNLTISNMVTSHMTSNMVAKAVGIIITINLHMEVMIKDVVLHHLCSNILLNTMVVVAAATTIHLLDLDITTLILKGWRKEEATQLTKDIRKYLSVDFQEILTYKYLRIISSSLVS
jgi:hypothetical protein